MADTRSFKALAKFYKVHTLIMSVVFLEHRPGIDHLSIEDAAILIKEIKPGRAVLTHFGMRMLAANPYLQAKRLTQALGVETIAATDGMTLK